MERRSLRVRADDHDFRGGGEELLAQTAHANCRDGIVDECGVDRQPRGFFEEEAPRFQITGEILTVGIEIWLAC